jgi:cell wall-associated NlpC family hydrolase
MPKPGDFALVAIRGWAGRVIKFLQYLNGDGWSPFQHVVVSLGDGTVIQAEPGGAQIVPLSTYDGTNITWSDWDLTDEQRAAIVAAARKFVGVPYSWLDYAALIAHRLHLPIPGLRRFLASTGDVICSQLADWAWQLGGVQIFADHRWVGYCTPASLEPALHGPVTAA